MVIGPQPQALRGPRSPAAGGEQGKPILTPPRREGGHKPSSDTPVRYAQNPDRALVHTREKLFLEVFAGTGRLSRAVARKGLPAEAWDIEYGTSCDVLQPRNKKKILDLIQSGRVAFLWLGFPCTTWSRARRNNGRGPGALRDDGEYLWGLPSLTPGDSMKVKEGNRLLVVAIELARCAAKMGIPFVLENPKTSRAWLTGGVISLQKLGATFFEADFCQYGERWRKATRFLGFRCPMLGDAMKKCTGPRGICSRTGEPHTHLSGVDEKLVFWTRRAQPYPHKLCHQLADSIVQQVLCWTTHALWA
jgi:hypothetical protein